MRITTWNINSVRLRIGLVERFLQTHRPDVLCLQETKCQNDQFPAKAFEKLGYVHQAVHGQKGYHGVATVARQPITDICRTQYCGKLDARHVAVTLGGNVILHNYYVPAGGDEPDRDANDKFAHKLDFLEQMRREFRRYKDGRHVVVGDLNVAPLEHDVWSHKQLLKVVSHTPIEVAALTAAQRAGGFVDVMRELVPKDEKLYTWWSYRARDWRASNRGRRLDHIWVTEALRKRAVGHGRAGMTVHEDVRGWERTSDHAPVTLDFS
jgi:exodeoxyribonuclease-3